MYQNIITDNGQESMSVATAPADLSDAIARAVRDTFTDEQKTAMLELAAAILEKVVEAEVREVLSPKFEALYEGVIANVMQKLLMQALTKRAADAMRVMTD